ncbi:hypothetical protein EDD16DRAFT_1519532 [Pisolithus croceorrhizus]|nr:hypothetical protein EV401DRAFT_1891926 [Pisolithus croceorrhizus]KAI6119128.1 hypothetical protein EDD16DRAFT_1519532 [Pisolithus croceorrhizus]
MDTAFVDSHAWRSSTGDSRVSHRINLGRESAPHAEKRFSVTCVNKLCAFSIGLTLKLNRQYFEPLVGQPFLGGQSRHDVNGARNEILTARTSKCIEMIRHPQFFIVGVKCKVMHVKHSSQFARLRIANQISYSLHGVGWCKKNVILHSVKTASFCVNLRGSEFLAFADPDVNMLYRIAKDNITALTTLRRLTRTRAEDSAGVAEVDGKGKLGLDLSAMYPPKYESPRLNTFSLLTNTPGLFNVYRCLKERNP